MQRLRIVAVLMSIAGATMAAPPPPDLFHTLQRNSWYYASNDKTTTVYATTLGTGPKVVVLHGGFGANHEYMVSALERHLAGHEFVLFDQRGSLLSPYRGKLEELGVEDLVDDLEKLRTELGEERLLLMAHSMGTRVAYEYLRKYPDRVAGMILVGAFTPRTPPGEYFDAITKRGEAMVGRPEVEAQLAKEGLDKVTESSAARLQTLRWRLRFASVNMVRVERWRAIEGGRVYYNGEVGTRLSASAPASWDVPAMLGARRIPISVIQGDRDYVDQGASGWTALQQEPGPLAGCVEVAVLERAGHVAWLDDPDAFEAALGKALSRKGC